MQRLGMGRLKWPRKELPRPIRASSFPGHLFPGHPNPELDFVNKASTRPRYRAGTASKLANAREISGAAFATGAASTASGRAAGTAASSSSLTGTALAGGMAAGGRPADMDTAGGAASGRPAAGTERLAIGAATDETVLPAGASGTRISLIAGALSKAGTFAISNSPPFLPWLEP